MNLQQIQYFKTIAELEHYTKAAEILRVSQPSLSYSISELERELGVPLFFKKGRNIHLTPYGHEFLKYVNHSLQELEDGKKAMAMMKRPDRGTVKMVYATSMGIRYIPGLINSFYTNPSNCNIQINFEQRQTRTICDLLEKGSIHLGFGSYVDDDRIERFSVYTETMVLAVPKRHPLAKRSSVKLSDIASENIITFDQTCPSRKEIEKLFHEAGIVPHITYEVSNEIMLTGVVATGMGVGIVPKICGMDYGNVTTLKIEDCFTLRSMYMMWLRNGLLMPVVEYFRNFVIETSKNGNLFLQDGNW